MRHGAATLPPVISINVKITKELYGMEVSLSTCSFDSSFIQMKQNEKLVAGISEPQCLSSWGLMCSLCIFVG